MAHSAQTHSRASLQNAPALTLVRRIISAALLGLLGIAVAVGITSVFVQFFLIISPTFLINWYAWLTIVVILALGSLALRRYTRAVTNGIRIGTIGLTIGILMLAIGQITWHYRLTPTHPVVDHHPTVDTIFLGSYWRTPLGRAQAATELTAFSVYQSSGWWHLLARYGVGSLTLASCSILGEDLHARSLNQLVDSAARARGEVCPGALPLINPQQLTAKNPPELIIFAGPNQFLGQHLSESGWNFLTKIAHRSVRAAIILDGSLKIATDTQGKLVAITPVEDTTLTLSHELAEGTTSLGNGSISVAASTLSRFTITAGAEVLYAMSSQWGNIPSFFDSQPTDILQVADACSPGQPAFVPSPATSYRFVDGIGMVSLLSPDGRTCENINHGSVIRFPSP
ncbi:hypothetical protein [Ferrimicrobium sp.]|uniref:hypothetical protein n=1 Tax=Ferrimicrobium sp. TaxID=2926050 RepID=UPI00260677B2|nr:hypothetical protein [Ferrimicrobium sp.]